MANRPEEVKAWTVLDTLVADKVQDLRSAPRVGHQLKDIYEGLLDALKTYPPDQGRFKVPVQLGDCTWLVESEDGRVRLKACYEVRFETCFVEELMYKA